MSHGPIPDKPEQLIEETEMLLKATAASEDFDRAMQRVTEVVNTPPEQTSKLLQRLEAMANRPTQ